MREFEIGVVGAGYVGLATGASLAYLGNRVTLMDKDAGRIAALKRRELPIFEPGLGEVLAKCSGRIHFTVDLDPVVQGADVLFVAVGTPMAEGGSVDLSDVSEVARSIGRALLGRRKDHPLVVVNKSTVPMGSGDYISMLIEEGAEEEGEGKTYFLVVSNPEFLREGSALYDSLYPDRIVIGADSQEAIEVMRELYRPVIEQSFPAELDPRPKNAVPLLITDLASAEMIKYASNAFLAAKISFINEIANICELTGADIKSVAQGIGLDARIGSRFLNAGIGWGGSCFPKDVAALRAISAEYGYEAIMLQAVAGVNERQQEKVVTKLQQELHTLRGKRVALLGLSFKPNTDDLREAPSLKIARRLNSCGARVVGYDPVAGKAGGRAVPELVIVHDPYEAIEGAHAAVLITEWQELKEIDLKRAGSLMQEPRLLVDGRNVYDPEKVRNSGMLYRGFGRE